MPTFAFVIAGAARSGTTSLHRYLAQHAALFLPTAKELAFFAHPAGDQRQQELIAQFYAPARPGQRLGLTDANLLMVPEAGARLAAHNPDVTVLAILRNPIDRAYSAYWFCRLRGWEHEPSFEAALKRERKGLATAYDRVNFSYVEHGHYADQLTPIVQAVGGDRVHVLLTEDLSANPVRELDKIFERLEVSPLANALDPSRRHNRRERIRYPRLGALLETGLQPIRSVLRHVIPIRGRHWLRHYVVRRARGLNRTAAEVPPMDPATRAQLTDYFRPHNERLQTLLGRDLTAWNSPQPKH